MVELLNFRRLFAFSVLFALSQVALAWTITVQPGDTLYALALRHQVSLETLESANSLEGSLIRPGLELLVPSAGPLECVVQSGDSLIALATRHGVSVGELMSANGLSSQTVDSGTMLLIPAAAGGETYVVRTGDTLYDIALLYGTSVDDLIVLNDLEGDVIRPGDELLVQGTPNRPSGPEVVTVESGDSLWRIARSHRVSVRALAERNGLDAAATLRAGTSLILPGHDRIVHDRGGAAPSAVTVAPGDTLSSLAVRYGTSVAALMSANDLKSTRIKVGQRLLVIPGNELAPAAAEAAAAVARLAWPVPGVVTSRFGYRNLRVNGSNFHNAIDIDGVTGEPVRAAASGVVTFSGWSGSYGKLVKIRSGETEYRYAHNSELLVSVGERVDVGEPVARVGNTGLSFGDHVHFEVRVAGAPVDPLPLLQRR